MSKILRKKMGSPSLQAVKVAVAKEEASDQEVFVLNWCECGNLITQRSHALQEADPAVKKKCFNCLLHERRLTTVTRTKDGWES